MKRERPPMPPLAVRVKVAERQVLQLSGQALLDKLRAAADGCNTRMKLMVLLGSISTMLDASALALDHDPALILRPYNPRIKDVAARYSPHAHDPDALIYREKANHQQKTTGRKPGAARTITTKGSDIGIKTKFARLERKKTQPRRPRFKGKLTAGKLIAMPKRSFENMVGWLGKKSKIPSRPFAKGRKFRKP